MFFSKSSEKYRKMLKTIVSQERENVLLVVIYYHGEIWGGDRAYQ